MLCRVVLLMNQSPKMSPQTVLLKTTLMKNITKCFLRLHLLCNTTYVIVHIIFFFTIVMGAGAKCRNGIWKQQQQLGPYQGSFFNSDNKKP